MFLSYLEIHDGSGLTQLLPERAMVDLTPREQHVLEALKLGLPNKLIAVRLNSSENTVKMHIQRIMRKCSAHNRTEAVLRWSRRANGHAPALTRAVILRVVCARRSGRSPAA